LIRTEAFGGYSIITIDRAERANALNIEHCRDLTDAVAASVARADRSLVLTGTGKSFSAGADFGDVSGDGFGQALYGLLQSLTAAPMPVVAAVNGHAIGAGLQLALACDLRVVAAEASFAAPTARLGLAYDPWTIERLVAFVGAGHARRILMTCDRFAADDPAVEGLVDKIGSLDDSVALAADLATMAPLTLRYMKTAIDALIGGVHDADEVRSGFEACWSSDDFVEGLAARQQKRPPVFGGR
jgi:enoyl-CoA hydratase